MKAVQTQSGLLTIAEHGNRLLVWAGDSCHLIDNPALSDRAIEIDFEIDSKSTIQQIKAAIDAAVQAQRDADSNENQQGAPLG